MQLINRAGSIVNFVDVWNSITKNKVVLDIASNCRIDFVDNFPPVQLFCPLQICFSKSESDIIDLKLTKLIFKGVIRQANSSSSSSSSRDGLIGPLPAKCRPEAFDAHSFTTFRERGKTG